jgi:outer membrane receptor protein involved in Fe transport
MLSDSLLWTMRVGADRIESPERPTSGDVETIAHYNWDTGMFTGNYWLQEDAIVDRRQAATDLSRFAGGPLGSHEVKFGLQYSDMAWARAVCFTGTAGGVGCTPGMSGHVFGDIVDEEGVVLPSWLLENDPTGEQVFSGDLWVAYAQDTWRPTPRLSVKLGLRYDRILYANDVGDRVADMSEWQPRVGLAWDLSGDAKNLLRASVGRFMDPSTLGLPVATTSQWPTDYNWWSCSTWGPIFGIPPDSCQVTADAYGLWWRDDSEGWDPHGWFLNPAVDIIPGGSSTPIDADLKAAYSDQLVLGYERELWQRSSVELSYVNKKTRQLFDDTCQGNLPEPSEGADCSFMVLANLPQLRRDYKAFLVSFESRGLDWLTIRASYIYSESTGKTGDWYGFDVYPWHFENRDGYLGDHRRHYLRIHGFVLLPYQFSIGFGASATSAFRWTPIADVVDAWLMPEIQEIQGMPNGAYFLEPRGSREGYSWNQLDLQFSKGFRLGSRTRLELILSVLNVFSTEHPEWVCESISGCGDFELGDPISWQTPRSWELGVRFEF